MITALYWFSVNSDLYKGAPMAYMSLDDIVGVIHESVDVIDIMKSIYSFKASD